MIPQSVSIPIAYENPLNLDVLGSASCVLESSSVVVDTFPGDVLELKVVAVVVVVVFESVVSLDAIVVVDMIVMLVLALVLVAVPVVVGFVTAVV